jgi:hypothetical protein
MAALGAVWLASILGKLSVSFLQRVSPSHLAARFSRRRISLSIFAVVAAAMALNSAWAVWRFHPYYIDYYNLYWGGTANVAKNRLLEFSWWGEGLTPATRWINRHAKKGARVFLAVRARHVMVFRPDIRIVGRLQAADFAIFSGPAVHRSVPPGFRLGHAERADGAPLVAVYRRQLTP